MAITLIARPQDITPAYNPVKWIVDSNVKNYDGFRYVFKIKDDSSNVIAEYRLLPNYGTGYGEQDLSKLLSNYVFFDSDTFFNFVQDINDVYFLFLSEQDAADISSTQYAYLLDIPLSPFDPKPNPPIEI